MDLIGLIFYYIFGVLGAWLGLVTTVYVFYSYAQLRKLHRTNFKMTKLDRFILRLYSKIGLDFENDDFVTSKIGLDVVLVCGLYAALGTYAFLISFIFVLVSYITITLIQLIKK